MNKKQRLRDAHLVNDYLSGDQKALSLLVKFWHKEFCRRSFWITQDAEAAKDIAQDSWKVIIKSIGGLKKPQLFGGWALRIVHTKSIDYLKALAREKEKQKSLKYIQEQESIITYNDEDKIKLKQQLLKTISELKEQQQLVIKLFYVQDYSLKEISEMLNISVGTAKSRLFYAREKLKKLLNKNN